MSWDRVKSRAGASLVVAAFIVLASTLGACGGGSGSSSSAESTTGQTAKTGEAASAAGGPEGSASASGLTPPDTELEVGETATVSYVPFEEEGKGGAHQGLEAKVAVTEIEERTQGDLSGIELEPEEKEKTPFFVEATVEAVGAEEPPEGENPALRLSAVDDRGQEAPSLTILGEFPACEEVLPPEHFVAGESFKTCFIYLVREGGSVAEMQWGSGPTDKDGLSEYLEHPVTWNLGSN
jgi:hypothetical protein